MDITDLLISNINSNNPISFLKFGDGEFICVFTVNYNTNCDGDFYTQKLKEGLINSIKYAANNDNIYIGSWDTTNGFGTKNTSIEWINISSNKLKWAFYTTFIFENIDIKNNTNKIEIYKSIKNYKYKKIIVCNPLLIKAKSLLNIDHVVNVAFNNWFDLEFDKILNTIKYLIGEDTNFMILTCCGMSAKVLLYELHKLHPNGIYLDIGSGLDRLCTKRDTRGWGNYSYEELENYCKDILPEDWNDSKYDYIYPIANEKLGLHYFVPLNYLKV